MENIIEKIKTMLDDSGLGEEFIELVIKRLESLSYDVKEEDAWLLGFTINTVVREINNSCNTIFLPDELTYIAIDRVCGNVLLMLKQTNKLGESFDFEIAIKQVHTGDTTVVFQDDSPEKRFDNFINYLCNIGEGDLLCSRKIKW